MKQNYINIEIIDNNRYLVSEKKNKKFKIIIYIISFMILTLVVTYILLEIIFKKLIRNNSHLAITYIAMIKTLFLLTYIGLKIITIFSNIKLKDNAKSKQLENKAVWIFDQHIKNYYQGKSISEINLTKTIAANEYETYINDTTEDNHQFNTKIKTKIQTEKKDIEQLYFLIHKYKNNNNQENNKDLYDYFNVFLVYTNYIPKIIKDNCFGLLKDWDYYSYNIGYDKNIEIIDGIVNQIFEYTNSYEEYTSVWDFIKCNIFNTQDKVKTELYLTKINEICEKKSNKKLY